MRRRALDLSPSYLLRLLRKVEDAQVKRACAWDEAIKIESRSPGGAGTSC